MISALSYHLSLSRSLSFLDISIIDIFSRLDTSLCLYLSIFLMTLKDYRYLVKVLQGFSSGIIFSFEDNHLSYVRLSYVHANVL